MSDLPKRCDGYAGNANMNASRHYIRRRLRPPRRGITGGQPGAADGPYRCGMKVAW
jgi:hypothetical protein